MSFIHLFLVCLLQTFIKENSVFFVQNVLLLEAEKVKNIKLTFFYPVFYFIYFLSSIYSSIYDVFIKPINILQHYN